MRGVRRVETMLDAQLYESWQEYLQHYRRTGQKELRWLIEQAVDKFYATMAEERHSQMQMEGAAAAVVCDDASGG